jgi:hypothetical protein
VQGLKSNKVGLFYDISTGSDNEIFFPFMLSGYQKGESWKDFSNRLRCELLSFSMAVKTDFVLLA